MILDSGDRRTFDGGAVRDIQDGKGACWMLPLEEVCDYLHFEEQSNYVEILLAINCFIPHRNPNYIYRAIRDFSRINGWDGNTMLLELSKHFEEGAAKYEPFNWTKGIKAHCYVDSAIRHYLKWSRGDKDESHARAFLWNLFCLLWTIRNKPEYDDLDSILTVQKEVEINAEN